MKLKVLCKINYFINVFKDAKKLKIKRGRPGPGVLTAFVKFCIGGPWSCENMDHEVPTLKVFMNKY